MRQDNDVARMAAALRTPSLRYRSFGNEPVRHTAPREPVPPADTFPLLGEALAGIEALPPDIRMAEPLEPPLPLHEPPVVPPAPVLQPAPIPQPSPPALSATAVVPRPEPVLAPPPPVIPTVAPAPVFTPAVPAPPPPAPAVPTLLQTLLAQPPASPAEMPPLVVGRYPPQDPLPAPVPAVAAPPVTVAPRPVLPPPVPPATEAPILAPPGWTRPAEPVLPSAPPLAPPRSFAAPPPPPLPRAPEESRPRSARASGGSGSSLLDTLIGSGGSSESSAHYPLLDALSVAMRTDSAESSARLWPAARVEMALPELLRRVAAGVRSSRGMA